MIDSAKDVRFHHLCSTTFLIPHPNNRMFVLIDAATLQKAQRMIGGCEAGSEHAELPFENILDRVDRF